MNEWLYAGLEVGGTILGGTLVLNTLAVAATEYRNRKLSDGKVGVLYIDDAFHLGENLREPFSTLVYLAEPVLEPLRDIALCIPGECLGENIYRWKHPKDDSAKQTPIATSPSQK